MKDARAKDSRILPCCLCGDSLMATSCHSAHPIVPGGRCCARCNRDRVVPARLVDLFNWLTGCESTGKEKEVE